MDSSASCTCDKDSVDSLSCETNNTQAKTACNKRKISLTSLGFNLRRGRSLKAKRGVKGGGGGGNSSSSANGCSPPTSSTVTQATGGGGSKKSPKWQLKFTCAKRLDVPKVAPSTNDGCCKCTCYKQNDEEAATAAVAAVVAPVIAPEQQVDDEVLAKDVVEPPEIEPPMMEQAQADVVLDNNVQVVQHPSPPPDEHGIYGNRSNTPPPIIISAPSSFFDMQWRVRPMHEDCDEAARRQRAKEIEQGVEPPANFKSTRRVQLLCSDIESSDGSSHAAPRRLQIVCPSDLSVDSLRALFQNHVTVRQCPIDVIAGCHTQVDFIHCLVPDLLSITNCSFYWGKMDRYEAERLLDGKPEGTFLLRDSAQEEFLFSVSFRKYGRSLHARIEQWNHKFSFDSHDPGVYTSDTVCGLMEHYKDPSSCMFFEPVLTWPLHRNFTFSLQHLCRATITSRLTYDDVNQLHLPKTLKSFLKEYHYRQKVRVERFDDDMHWIDLRNMPT